MEQEEGRIYAGIIAEVWGSVPRWCLVARSAPDPSGAQQLVGALLDLRQQRCMLPQQFVPGRLNRRAHRAVEVCRELVLVYT